MTPSLTSEEILDLRLSVSSRASLFADLYTEEKNEYEKRAYIQLVIKYNALHQKLCDWYEDVRKQERSQCA